MKYVFFFIYMSISTFQLSFLLLFAKYKVVYILSHVKIHFLTLFLSLQRPHLLT